MKVFKGMRRILLALKYLFQFKRPVFDQLDFIDIVFNRQGFFLLSWGISKAYQLSIPAAKVYYLKQQGSVAVRIPDNCTELKLTIRSLWRKNSKIIKLTRIELTAQTTLPISVDLEKLCTGTAKTKTFDLTFPGTRVSISRPKSKQVNIAVKTIIPTIKPFTQTS